MNSQPSLRSCPIEVTLTKLGKSVAFSAQGTCTVAKIRFWLSGRHDLDEVSGNTTLISREITPGLAAIFVNTNVRKDFSGRGWVCVPAPQEQPLSLSASSPRKILHQPPKVSSKGLKISTIIILSLLKEEPSSGLSPAPKSSQGQQFGHPKHRRGGRKTKEENPLHSLQKTVHSIFFFA